MSDPLDEPVTWASPQEHVPPVERCNPCVRWTTDGDDNTFCPDCGLTANQVASEANGPENEP